MGENTCLICVVGSVVAAVILLLVIVLPLSFVTLEYDEVCTVNVYFVLV
jgi:hypothetical protein